jgi:aryl-alcohol dehydrogenase-like predicted oxidoreductase
MKPLWLSANELRVGLGCMRLSTDPDRDESRARNTLRTALEAGITVFDTARAYALHEGELGHNEQLLARALREAGAADRARVITKGGMQRPEGRWQPDGRGASIRADCEASLEALGGISIDLYLLHAPDPKTAWSTSVRALGSLVAEGLVRRVGLSNVNRRQLDEALDLAPISAVELALSVSDTTALLGGVVARCAELGLAVIAHSPLGGPRQATRLSKDAALEAVAARHGATAQEVALAALLDLHPSVVVIPGACRPETARSAAAAAHLRLDEEDWSRLRDRLPSPSLASAPRAQQSSGDAEVVLLMGMQGAGKTEALSQWVTRGYQRLNRDERGGTLRALNAALEERLAAGARRVVMDNTYVTRAQRREVIEAAWRHGARVHGVWLDTPLPQAQVNVVRRMLTQHGRLLAPEELKGKDPSQLAPNALFRTAREMEPPAQDEGFEVLEVVAFQRAPRLGHERAARFIAYNALFDDAGQLRAAALGEGGDVARLVYAWKPELTWSEVEAAVRRAQAQTGLALSASHCPHPAGPPKCWCRPPLPGLPLAFAEVEKVDLARSVVVGTGPAHRTMAAALGCSYEEVIRDP